MGKCSFLKPNRAHTRNQAQFQARLQAQKNAYRQDVEDVAHKSVKPQSLGIFKSDDAAPLNSVDDLVVAGNRHFENLDNVNFAKFRNDKELGQKVLAETKEQLAQFHDDTTSEAYKKDLRRVLAARYLQGHGVRVERHLDDKEMVALRRYIQRETSTNNVADAARSINASLKAGEEDVPDLLMGAERHLYHERGISQELFEAKFADKSMRDLAKTRDFADAWSTSQSGRFLRIAEGQDFGQLRDSMTREMLSARGYQNVDGVNLDTALSLLRDIDPEGPRTNATISKTVNEALEAGEKNYFVLSTLSNQAILKELGMTDEALANMHVSNKALKKKYPKLESPQEARAIRTRVLRDLLRVLPDEERSLAIEELAAQGADLISAEKILSKHLGERIREYSGHSAPYGKMGAMQRANLASALSKLPEEVRSYAFDGPNDSTVDRMEEMIESRFGIDVHREPGKAANGNSAYEPFVKDWTVQGTADLYNALSSMAGPDGKPPIHLWGNSVISYMEGAPKYPSMSVGKGEKDDDPVGPWNRPGAYAHASGKSGYYGEAAPNEQGSDILFIYDDAMKGSNGDSAVGLSIGEGTIIHEFGHATQLGGTPGADTESRQKEDQLRMAEWSSLSRWEEPHGVLADGRMGSFEYYYDPTVQVGKREEVATSYGASDPCEDFAEFTPFFYKDPETAMGLSAEKFLYMNDLVGGFYSQEQTEKIASNLGLDGEALARARASMEKKVAEAPSQAQLQGFAS